MKPKKIKLRKRRFTIKEEIKYTFSKLPPWLTTLIILIIIIGLVAGIWALIHFLATKHPILLQWLSYIFGSLCICGIFYWVIYTIIDN